MLKQLSKYSVSGGFAAAVNFSSRILYNTIFGFNASLVLAYFSGLLVNYFLTSRYVFREGKSTNSSKQFTIFVLVASAGLLVTYMSTIAALVVVNKAFQLETELAKSLAHILGIGCGFLCNFMGHKTITFKLPLP
jgi:putative flippase GtrA